MAKKKKISYYGGHILFEGVRQSKIDELRAYIYGKTEIPDSPKLAEHVPPTVDLSQETYGVCGKSGEWKTVTIKYNELTKEAYVSDVYTTDAKAIAVSEFMKKCSMKGIV